MQPPTPAPLVMKRFIYYGPWEDPKNTQFWLPAKNIVGQQVVNKLPWTSEALDQHGIDLYTSNDVMEHHVTEGWTFLVVIGFRDRVYYGHYFIAEGEHSRDSMVAATKERFPEVVRLYNLESVLCSPPAREAEATTQC